MTVSNEDKLARWVDVEGVLKNHIAIQGRAAAINTPPTSDKMGLVPPLGKEGQVLMTSNGDAKWSNIPVFTGATATNAGTVGLVPAPNTTEISTLINSDPTLIATLNTNIPIILIQIQQPIWNINVSNVDNIKSGNLAILSFMPKPDNSYVVDKEKGYIFLDTNSYPCTGINKIEKIEFVCNNLATGESGLPCITHPLALGYITDEQSIVVLTGYNARGFGE